MTRSLAWTVALVACVVIGCGGDSGEPAPVGEETTTRLSARENRVVVAGQESVASYCRGRARELAGGKPTTTADLERVTVALEHLAALARAEPEAETRSGATVRLALGDIAENLEGTNCDDRLVELIDTQLATLPPG